MDKLCINCDTENPVDAVFCSECGMSMTGAAREETAPPKSEQMRRTKWALRLAGMVCWTILVGAGGFCYGGLALFSTGGAFSSREVQEYEAMARTAWQCTIVLVLAPWVIGGILFGARWWRSRTPAPPQATE